MKRCTIDDGELTLGSSESLGPIHRNHGVSPTPRIVPVPDLSPRRILLHERLAALRTVPRNLRQNQHAGCVRTERQTHVAVFLASVARLHGRFGVIHVLREDIRQTSLHTKCQVQARAYCAIGSVTAAVALDGWERSGH